jgi:hypothetical protein
MRIRIRNPLQRSEFVPTSGRRRLLFAALALGTTATLAGAMLLPHAAYVRGLEALGLREPPPCPPGQLRGCVGGLMDVVVVPAPPAAAASAASAAASAPATAGATPPR